LEFRKISYEKLLQKINIKIIMKLIAENIKGKKNYKNENKRNYGIDLLRMYSMFSIIILHINVYSGQLYKLPINKPIWHLEAMSYFAVDCFGLISLYTKK
jgi:hypothetical protein